MTLAELIAQHPEWSELADWELVDLLNQPSEECETKLIPVAVSTVRLILMASPEMAWGQIAVASRSDNLAAAVLATTIREALSPNGWQQLGTDDEGVAAAVQAALAAAAGAGWIGEQTMERLLELMTGRKSWAEQLGIVIDARAVGLARGGKA